MSQVGESSFDMDVNEIFGEFTKGRKTKTKPFDNKFIDELKEIGKDINFSTTLTNSASFEDVIEIEMTAK